MNIIWNNLVLTLLVSSFTLHAMQPNNKQSNSQIDEITLEEVLALHDKNAKRETHGEPATNTTLNPLFKSPNQKNGCEKK